VERDTLDALRAPMQALLNRYPTRASKPAEGDTQAAPEAPKTPVVP
jgi:hypothetical protein